MLAALRTVRWEPWDMSTWSEELTIRARLLAQSANAANYSFSLARGEQEVLAGTALVAMIRSPTVTSVKPLAT